MSIKPVLSFLLFIAQYFALIYFYYSLLQILLVQEHDHRQREPVRDHQVGAERCAMMTVL